MKKFLTFLFLTSTLCQASEPNCGATSSYLLLNANNKQILSENNAEKITYPASLVKLMTLYLTFEALQRHRLRLDQVLKISERGEEISKINQVNSLNLKAGDKITVRQAINAMLVRSFNEAAVVLAEAVAGSEWEFARRMNKKARELGMISSSFRNASGLHEEGQYSNAYDFARLALAIRKNFPNYYQLLTVKKFTYRGTEYETHNKIMLEYKGAEGGKTGFTNAAGFNLLSVARDKKQRAISVLLGCPNPEIRYLVTRHLLDQGFATIEKCKKARCHHSRIRT